MSAIVLSLAASACGDDDVDVSAPEGTAVASAEADDPIAEPEHFGSAQIISAAHPDCDTVVSGDEVTVEAGGYHSAAEVIVSLQLVDGEPTLVATVVADDDGTVSVPFTLPEEAPGAIGGLEVIGEGPDGLLLNEALLLFGKADECDAAP